MNEELKTILDEMCSRVGVSNIDFTIDFWWEDHTWTSEQEIDFRDWLANYLYENNEARKLFVNLRKVKRDCKKAANKFIFAYGWKTKDS